MTRSGPISGQNRSRIVAASDNRFYQRIVSESGQMSIVFDVRLYTRIGSDYEPIVTQLRTYEYDQIGPDFRSES